MNKKVVAIIAVILLIILVAIGGYSYYKKSNEKNWDLVFDAKYYADANPDIDAACGGDEQKLLEHFVNYGMQEGRRASLNFNAYYYRENNADLVAVFGDNFKAYYEHYIDYGRLEGRRGSTEDFTNQEFECQLNCVLQDSDKLRLSVEFKENGFDKYYVFEMAPYEYELEQGEIVAEGRFLHEKNIEIDGDNLTNKYIVAKKNGDKYEAISNFAYIENPEMACVETDNKLVTPKSKKGLQISQGVFDDVQNLDTSYVFTNIFIDKILMFEYVENNTIEYDYNGQTYYFDKTGVQYYDDIVSKFTKDGNFVIASMLLQKKEGYDALFYPGISMDTGTSFYAINTSEEAGEKYFEAFVAFVSERYNGTNEEFGCVGKWVVGNEVNESGTYNYMGDKNVHEYIEEYERTFRIAYNIIKSKNSSAGVYLPFEPFWGIDSVGLTYGGREFLNIFNSKIKERGNIDWGLAYHAYSYPLSDPKIENDGTPMEDERGEFIKDLVTRDSFYAAMITMENIDVLTEFMNQKDFLNPEGECRSIILSEQGFTSNSMVYGKCEALQAASLVNAYYKAEMNEDIDAFIYFLQKDDNKASMGNNYYQFGLSDASKNKKLSYDVFKNMDKSDSLEKLGYIKNILGIEDYSEIIPNFDSTIFSKFDKGEEVNKIDLSSVQIKEIGAQKYTGAECLPEVQVEYNGEVLVNDVDYDMVYLNNVEPGEATVVVVGLNEFGGIKEDSFVIEK